MTILPRAWPTIAPRWLFLVDGLGVALSAVSLGLVLPAFARAVGVPGPVLHLLAFPASGLAAGSLLCFWARPFSWRSWLQRIAGANLLYSILTAALLWGRAPSLTAWDAAYFGLEMAVIVSLAGWELHTAARPSTSRD